MPTPWNAISARQHPPFQPHPSLKTWGPSIPAVQMRPLKTLYTVKRYFFIGMGSLFLVIGIVGIFLPLLPTTPFFILTAICYNKGSKKFHSWLIGHRVFGLLIIDWQKNRVIKNKYKLLATGMMTITTLFVFTNETIPIVGKVSYAILFIVLLAFIWSQKSKPTN